MRLVFSAISDVGRIRKDNQDSGYVGPHLVAVCDGVGGAARGDIASSTAIGQLRKLDETPPPPGTIESELPRPQVEFDVLLPYERGDLVNRIHQEAEIGSLEHTGDGTLVVGRANADLASELTAYAR